MKKFFLLFLFMLLFTDKTYALATMAEPEIKQAQNYGLMNYQKSIPEFIKPWMAYEESSKKLDGNSEKAYIYSPYYLVAINARERLLASQTINISDGEVVLQNFHNSLPFGVTIYVEDVTDFEKSLTANLIQNEKKVQAYAVRVQDISVVKTKKIQETVTVKTTSTEKVETPAVSEDKKEKDNKKTTENKKPVENKKTDKDEEKVKETDLQEVKTVVVEKTVPALYCVQLFVYFDIRMINIYTPSTLTLELADGQKRKFFFDLNSIN